MILKKPYAFLIKYFKLINFILSVFSIFIVYKTYNVVSFFNEYIHQNYSGNYYSGFYESYISSFLFFIIVLIIIGISAIFLLFIYKKKPLKIYLASIVNYIVLFVFFSIVKSVMITLETDIITAEVSRIYRDVSLILIVPQILFILSFLIRGLGFNIKKFNFQEDLKELEISEKDNEEVEITFKQDGTNLKRTFRRFKREFKYYIKENKFMVGIVVLIIMLIVGLLIYKSLPEVYDQEYSQGDYFTIGELKYNIKDSIITNLDYKGDTLGEDVYYVVAKLYIENTSINSVEIDYNDFRLEVNDKYIYPSIDKGLSFIDYAANYTGKKINAESNKLFSLVYEITEKEKKDNYKIKISNGSVFTDNINIGKFNYINITPVEIVDINLEKSVSVGEEIQFKNSNLGASSLTLSNPIITSKYIYNYEICKNENCDTYKDVINIDILEKNKKLIIMDYKYNLSKEVPFYEVSNNISGLADNFIKIKYIENNELVKVNVKNVTPQKLKDKIVLEVSNEIEKSSEVYISITIRNKEYLIKIK